MRSQSGCRSNYERKGPETATIIPRVIFSARTDIYTHICCVRHQARIVLKLRQKSSSFVYADHIIAKNPVAASARGLGLCPRVTGQDHREAPCPPDAN